MRALPRFTLLLTITFLIVTACSDDADPAATDMSIKKDLQPRPGGAANEETPILLQVLHEELLQLVGDHVIPPGVQV